MGNLSLGGLVRDKPTAYGRATLGAKPFRRAPLPAQYGMSLVKTKPEATGRCPARKHRRGGAEPGHVVRLMVCVTNPGPNGAFLTCPPRFAGQAKPTPYGRGRLVEQFCVASRDHIPLCVSELNAVDQ